MVCHPLAAVSPLTSQSNVVVSVFMFIAYVVRVRLPSVELSHHNIRLDELR